MPLETKLANELIRKYPGRAASVLERLDAAQGARVLGRAARSDAAELLERLSPQRAAAVLEALPEERVAEIFEELPIAVASRLMRRLGESRAEAVLALSSPRIASGLRALIRFPENTAGALMDPTVLAVPESFSAREALDRVREAPDQARYNVYVLGSEQRLVGVLNLRELFLAQPRARLSELMVRNPISLPASADRGVVVSHPGWREVYALPVVDDDGVYLGAIRYRTLRELEELLFHGGRSDADAPAALGELFAAGAGGLLDALSAPVQTRSDQR